MAFIEYYDAAKDKKANLYINDVIAEEIICTSKLRKELRWFLNMQDMQNYIYSLGG